MSDKRNLLLLFDRPCEPIFMKKGPNNAKFDVPSHLLSNRYKNSPAIGDRFGEDAGERIAVTSNVSVPDLTVPQSLGKDEQFSILIPRHREIAGRLINIFMGKYSARKRLKQTT